jgi:hypothetical protein
MDEGATGQWISIRVMNLVFVPSLRRSAMYQAQSPTWPGLPRGLVRIHPPLHPLVLAAASSSSPPTCISHHLLILSFWQRGSILNILHHGGRFGRRGEEKAGDLSADKETSLCSHTWGVLSRPKCVGVRGHGKAIATPCLDHRGMEKRARDLVFLRVT